MLSDIPTFPPTVPTADDLLAVIDSSDRRSPKRATVAQVIGAGSGYSGGGYVIDGYLSPVPGVLLEGGMTGRFRIEIGPSSLPSQSVSISSFAVGAEFPLVFTGLRVVSGYGSLNSTSGMVLESFTGSSTVVEVNVSNPTDNLAVFSVYDPAAGYFLLKITRIA
jgi:hypothetical protein